VRILIVDDHPFICESLGLLISARAEKSLSSPVSISHAFTLAEALSAIGMTEQGDCPDLVFLDLNLGHGNVGLSTFRQYAEANIHGIPTAICSGIAMEDKGSAGILKECIAHPFVTAVLLKNTDIQKAFVGLDRILAGEFWIPKEVMLGIAVEKEGQSNQGYSLLAPHEKRVADELCRGHSAAVMAHNLGLSEGHVRQVCSQIYRKLGVHNRTSAVIKLTEKEDA
jgi:two-component system nitrate/nitrite response regulator NarL